MGLSGLEPPTSRLSGVRSNQLSYKPILKSFDFSGDEEIRTLDPLLARQVLSQLSYTPTIIWHPPALPCRLQHSTIGRLRLNRRVRDGNGCFPQAHRHRKHYLLGEVFSSLVNKLVLRSRTTSFCLDNSTVKHIFSTSSLERR